MRGTPWTREDIIVAYALYCVTPLSKINASNKLIRQVADIIPHSVGSLVLRMQNFRCIDPNADKGMGHAAKIDKVIFEEFRHDWGTLSTQAEQLTGLALFDGDPINGARRLSSLTSRNKVSRERHFFRRSVLSAYEYRCCISGLTLPALLVASHIKPYQKCNSGSDRVNPENGLCLNTLYDRAFDQGLITIDPHLTIWVSKEAEKFSDEFTEKWLLGLQGETILYADKFHPAREYLEYHNEKVFKG